MAFDDDLFEAELPIAEAHVDPEDGLAPALAVDEPDGDAPPATSRKVRRRGRRTRMRSKTIAMKRLTKEELRIGALLYPTPDVPRPITRGECKDAPRPCPWVSCKYHLYLDVNPETGSIKINFPDLEPWELNETCALDVADRGGTILFFAPADPGARVAIPFNDLWREEVTLTSSYGGAPRDIEAAIAVQRSRQVPVADMITHRLPLERAAEGFRLVAAAEASLKVVLRP